MQQAQEDVRGCGFTATRTADEGNARANRNRKVDPLQHPVIGVGVAVPNVVKTDRVPREYARSRRNTRGALGGPISWQIEQGQGAIQKRQSSPELGQGAKRILQRWCEAKGRNRDGRQKRKDRPDFVLITA